MAVAVTMKDLGIGQLKADVAKLKTQPITVGFQGASGSATHPGTDGVAVAQVGAWMEFGTPGSDDRLYDQIRRMVPSRPFLRTTFVRYRDEIKAQLKDAIRDLITGTATLIAVQDRLGKFLVGLVGDTIDDAKSWAEPLAPSTVERKGHDAPLEDTGTLRDAVTYAVREGDAIVRQGGT